MILHKMASRSSPGSLRGAPGVSSGRPKRAPRGAKGAPRRPQEQSGLGGHLGQTLRPKDPHRPPGRHFGPLGVRFWPLRESILEAAQDPPGDLQGALGDPFWDNVEYIFDPSGAHRGFILGLPGLRSESSWSSRASQFWQDLAAKTPQHQARQGRPRPA